MGREQTDESLFEGIIGETALAIARTLVPIAKSEEPVLLTGETGVGKELFARRLHRASPRVRSEDAYSTFFAVNCAFFPDTLIESELFGHTRGAFTGADRAKKGVFELAHGGTLFLDEIGDMTPPSQAKILRFLETKEFQRLGEPDRRLKSDVRIIAATSKPENLRKDLLYRFNRRFEVPALNDRLGDVPDLVEYAICRGQKAEATEDEPVIDLISIALTRLSHWPGNVRQLFAVFSGIRYRDVHRAIPWPNGFEISPKVVDIMQACVRPEDYPAPGVFRTPELDDVLAERTISGERPHVCDARRISSMWIERQFDPNQEYGPRLDHLPFVDLGAPSTPELGGVVMRFIPLDWVRQAFAAIDCLLYDRTNGALPYGLKRLIEQRSNRTEEQVVGLLEQQTAANVANPAACDSPTESTRPDREWWDRPLADVQNEQMARMVDACGGNKTVAARRLDCSRGTLRKWLAKSSP